MKNYAFNQINWLFLILLFCNSCDEDITLKGQSSPSMCVIVKDQITNLPVKDASVVIYPEKSDGTSYALYGTTDAEGKVYFEYFDFLYLNEIDVTAVSFERTCKTFLSDRNIATTREVLLLKKSSIIQFHLINQVPRYNNDSLTVSISSNLNGCYVSDYGIPFSGMNVDTIYNSFQIAGSNSIRWQLYRNYNLINDSTFDVNVPIGDTTFVQIEY